jgi:hypothetical protein
MKRKTFTILSTIIAVLFCQSFSNSLLAKSGNTEEITLQLGSFSKIGLNGGYEVELVQGNEESITIVSEKEMLNKVKAEISNGLLEISTKKEFLIHKIKLVIKFKNIEEIKIDGGMSLKSKQTVQVESLALKVNGGADIKLGIIGKSLKLDLAGGTNAEIKGNVANLEILLGGAGNISADLLEAENVKVEIDGAGYAKVWATKSIDAQLAGVGVIEYKGNPANVKTGFSGIGSIRQKE